MSRDLNVTTRKFTITVAEAAWLASTSQIAGIRMSDLVQACIENMQAALLVKQPAAIDLVDLWRLYRHPAHKRSKTRVARPAKRT